MRLVASGLLIVAVASAQALAPGAAEILRRAGEADARNGPLNEMYTHSEYIVTTHLDGDGKPGKRETETWDVVMLEGAPYRKLIQRNDKPLTTKEQKSEDKRQTQEAEKRRKERDKPPKNGPLTYTVGYGRDSGKLFDFAVVRQEAVNGRLAYLLEGLPKPDIQPANDNDEELLHYRVRMWVDQAEFNTARFEMEVVKPGSRMQVGSLFGFRSIRMEDGAWLLEESRLEMALRTFKIRTEHQRTVTTNSNFRKFAVESQIIDAVQ